MAGTITPEELDYAVQYYVCNDGYLRACRPGAARIDLNGEPAGEVSAQHAARAAAQLARRRLQQTARKLAKSESTENRPQRLGLAALKALGARADNNYRRRHDMEKRSVKR